MSMPLDPEYEINKYKEYFLMRLKEYHQIEISYEEIAKYKYQGVFRLNHGLSIGHIEFEGKIIWVLYTGIYKIFKTVLPIYPDTSINDFIKIIFKNDSQKIIDEYNRILKIIESNLDLKFESKREEYEYFNQKFGAIIASFTMARRYGEFKPILLIHRIIKK